LRSLSSTTPEPSVHAPPRPRLHAARGRDQGQL